MTQCPKCGAPRENGARFCEQCQFDFEGVPKKDQGVQMGDKNVIAGDVISHKESYTIAGNATIIKNEDESKKMVQCAICGKNMPVAQSFECQGCHQIVCDVCFDKMAGMCKKCAGETVGASEDAYRAAITEALSDGKIDVTDRKKLMALQKQLGIAAARAIQIEKEMKPAASGGETKNTAAFDKVNTDKAYNLLYVRGDYKKASELMASIYERHPEDENALSIYIAALAKFNPVKARAIIAKLQADVLCGALALVDIDIKHKDFASAEKRIASAFAIWPNSALLKCRKAVLAYELFKITEDSAPLMEAMELVESIAEPKDAIEKSWKFYAKRLIDSALGEDVPALDRTKCDSAGLLWDVISEGEDRSAALYRIIDVSAGPEAKFYPTYYMNTESIRDWSDEFKTDLIALRKIAPGTFTMGHGKNKFPSCDSSDGSYMPEIQNPEHTVTLTRAYFIGVFPMTQRQWELITGKRPSQFKAEPYYASRALDSVSFAELRGKGVGLKWPNSQKVDSNSVLGILRKKTGFFDVDLPTEAQWECACRAGSTSDFYSGKNLSEDVGENLEELKKLARFDANHYTEGEDDSREKCTGEANGPARVGMFSPNAWGLYDFYGNVSEWCLDPLYSKPCDIRGFYHVYDRHAVDPVGWGGDRDAKEDEGVELYDYTPRVVRGGNWQSDDPEAMTSWAREGEAPESDWEFGVRLVINVDADLSGRWSKVSNDMLAQITPDEVGELTKNAMVGDLNAELTIARCRWLGVGGLVKSIELAEVSLRSLIAQGLPLAGSVLADALVERSQNEAEMLGEAISLYRGAIEKGDLNAVRGYKNLLRAHEPFLSSLVDTCSKITIDRRSKFVVLAGAKLTPSCIAAMWKTSAKFLGWTDDMRPDKIVAAFVSANRGEIDNGATDSDDFPHFTLFTDEGIIVVQGYGCWGGGQYHSGYISWLDFVENGDVRRFGCENLYLNILKDSLVTDVPCEDDSKVKAYADVLACARSLYKGPLGGDETGGVVNPLKTWEEFHLEDLPRISNDQFAELNNLTGVKNASVELRRAICFENGFGCEADIAKAMASYRLAWQYGSDDAAKMLVKLASKGKGDFACELERMCCDYRNRLKDAVINDCKAKHPDANEESLKFILQHTSGLRRIDEKIVVDHSAVAAKVPEFIKKFASSDKRLKDFSPDSVVAVLPSISDGEGGALLTMGGIYATDVNSQGRRGGYLTWEEFLSGAVLRACSNRDLVLVDSPAKIVINTDGMRWEPSELKKFFGEIIDCANRCLNKAGQSDATDERSIEVNAVADESKKCKDSIPAQKTVDDKNDSTEQEDVRCGSESRHLAEEDAKREREMAEQARKRREEEERADRERREKEHQQQLAEQERLRKETEKAAAAKLEAERALREASEAKAAAELAKKEAELKSSQAKMQSQLSEQQNELARVKAAMAGSPQKRWLFIVLGLLGGWLGLHLAYARRWVLLALFWVSVIAFFVVVPAGAKSSPVQTPFALAVVALWLGGTFFIRKDGKKRRLS